jgi:hypothetical protein
MEKAIISVTAKERKRIWTAEIANSADYFKELLIVTLGRPINTFLITNIKDVGIWRKYYFTVT